jgi:single-stranded-DNA-specific exonuclease
LVDALTAAGDHLVKFGGHTKAAGLTVTVAKLKEAEAALLQYAETRLRDEDLGPQLVIDARLVTADVTFALIEQVDQLGPFGMGNPRPVFLLEGLKMTDQRLVGATGRHVKLRLQEPPHTASLGAIGFQLGDRVSQIEPSSAIDVAAQLEINEWRDRRDPELHLLDIRVANVIPDNLAHQEDAASGIV